MDTKVYVKPLNAHLYIPYSSFHPRSALTGVSFVVIPLTLWSSLSLDYLCNTYKPVDTLYQSSSPSCARCSTTVVWSI